MLVIPGRAEGANPESINAVVSGLIFAQRIPLKIVRMNSELGAARRPGMMAR
jgi:hypothetical protein